jgi:hypothetical protein
MNTDNTEAVQNELLERKALMTAALVKLKQSDNYSDLNTLIAEIIELLEVPDVLTSRFPGVLGEPKEFNFDYPEMRGVLLQFGGTLTGFQLGFKHYAEAADNYINLIRDPDSIMSKFLKTVPR